MRSERRPGNAQPSGVMFSKMGNSAKFYFHRLTGTLGTCWISRFRGQKACFTHLPSEHGARHGGTQSC